MGTFRLITLLLTTVAFSSWSSAAVVQSREGHDWWEHSVIYQIYPRSFMDSNNDGIGDLQGIISKLDHLKDAGITAAWLSPIYKSPQVDAGYDISDFMDVDEDYGTLADFDELVEKAHELGIKIVMDFVPNHSSNQHEWFKKSEAKDPEYLDYYIWKDGPSTTTPPNNWITHFKGSAWTYSTIRQQWYLHQFTKEQPDLNYRNSNLVQKMKDVLKFWLDKGVDGFRLDAVPYLVEDEGFKDEPLSGDPNAKPNDYGYLKHIYTADQPDTFDMIYQFRKFVDDYTQTNGGDTRVLMTEAYTDIKNTMLYYGNGERVGAHFTFNFQLITRVNKDSTARDIVIAIKEWLAYMPLEYTANWVLGNHDQHRVATRFGPKNVDGLNMLTTMLPGVMVTYNGEEIGMENGEVTYAQGQDPSACKEEPADFDKLSRDFERTPFHWDNTTNAGFTKSQDPWLPVSEKYKETNLKAQSDSNVLSHYQLYKKLVNLRQENALIDGKLQLEALSDNVLACTRTLSGSNTYLFVFNIGDASETVNLAMAFPDLGSSVQLVLSSDASRADAETLSFEELALKGHEGLIAVIESGESSTEGGASQMTVAVVVLLACFLLTMFH